MRGFLGSAVIAGFGGFATQGHADQLHVATDIAPVHSLVAMVMGDLGTPSLIVPQTASPHDHSMRPSEARALDNAEVVIWIGGALTPWLENAVSTLAEDAQVLSLMDAPETVTLPFREGARFEAHDHGHSHGHSDGHDEDHADAHEDAHHEDHEDAHDDDHGEDHAESHGEDHAESHGEDHAEEHEHGHEEKHEDGHKDEHAEGQDPHIWLDPENAMRWLPRIAEVLSNADPDNEAAYKANAIQAVQALQGQVTQIQDGLVAVQGKPFVVFHDAYHYFEARFDVEATGSIAASDAEAPSPKRLREIEEAIQETGAQCVFSEPQQRRDWVDAVAPHARLGELDPIGFGLELGPELYPELLNQMAGALSDCLNG